MPCMCMMSCGASRAPSCRAALHRGSALITTNAVVGIEGELYSDAGVVLRGRIAVQKVRRLPALVLYPGVYFHVFAQPFHGVYLKVVLSRAHGNEILRRLRIAILKLQPLVAAEVIGQPTLAALGLAADPVPEDKAFVGIRLMLHCLPVHEAAADAASSRWIGRDGLHAQRQLRRSREMRQIDAGPDCGAAGSADRGYVVV